MHNHQSKIFSNDTESTMKAELSSNADATMSRLRRRYPDIDFKESIRELCEYLKSECTPQQIKARGGNELTDPYVTAMMCMCPDRGVIGQLDYSLEIISYFWMMVNDPKPTLANNVGQYAVVDFIEYGVAKMSGGLFFSPKRDVTAKLQEKPAPVEMKLERFVQALYECRSMDCNRDVINNFCSKLEGFDQDVNVNQNLLPNKEKLRLAEAAATSFLGYNIVADRFDAQLEEIKTIIRDIISGQKAKSVVGLKL